MSSTCSRSNRLRDVGFFGGELGNWTNDGKCTNADANSKDAASLGPSRLQAEVDVHGNDKDANEGTYRAQCITATTLI